MVIQMACFCMGQCFGKSSLIKSIGMTVIMAQQNYLYHVNHLNIIHIKFYLQEYLEMTIFLKLSSFGVEISELRQYKNYQIKIHLFWR